MNAKLVYDGQFLAVPPSMGKPAPGQLAGTPLENLGEIACRICYDSLGVDENGKIRGRSSEKLHQHILDVKNTSVYEHCVFTVRFDGDFVNAVGAAMACVNRKGVWVECEYGGHVTDVTANFRAVLEWNRHYGTINDHLDTGDTVGNVLRWYGHMLAPRIIPRPEDSHQPTKAVLKTDNLSDDQAHISLWLYGSRGFTHEQVRHRKEISQRSTRYVDEDSSPYIEHPLVTKYLNDPDINEIWRKTTRTLIDQSIEADRTTYRILVADLESYNIRNGMDKHTARKQARGAARGYLGNALASEMIFTTSVAGWKWILSQRKSAAADAEIREIYTPGLEALKMSRYGDRFAEFTTIPSPDGLGTILA